MSHLALYRKYRPSSFDEVRGQSDAVSYLESIAQSGRVPHAILLTGSRGIGKTTLARIFGKALGIDAHDMYEIDAASYRKVENMRELLNDVLTLPVSSPYKLYILDEVHMLTNESFNTFLKTLEEPPRHVIFVLATTELNKVLPTVLSRCQVIHLKKPTAQILADQVIEIAGKEGKTIDRDSALLIADRAGGSFRDALVLLDQVMEQSTSSAITADEINKLGLRNDDHLVFEFIKSLMTKDSARLLEITNEVAAADSKSLSEFLEKLIHIIRLALYVKNAPSLWKQQEDQWSDEQVAMIADWSTQGAVTSAMLAQWLHVYEEVKRSTIAQVPVELAIMDVLGHNANQ